MVELGRAQGWFGPRKGVYLGLTGSGGEVCEVWCFRREDTRRQEPGLE